jgi:hypothetical protein
MRTANRRILLAVNGVVQVQRLTLCLDDRWRLVQHTSADVIGACRASHDCRHRPVGGDAADLSVAAERTSRIRRSLSALPPVLRSFSTEASEQSRTANLRQDYRRSLCTARSKKKTGAVQMCERTNENRRRSRNLRLLITDGVSCARGEEYGTILVRCCLFATLGISCRFVDVRVARHRLVARV